MKPTEFNAVLMLGGNLGATRKYFSDAVGLLNERVGEVVQVSGFYRTDPWGIDNQPAFLNQAIVVRTSLTAREILRKTKAIEEQLGRIRRELNGPREIDIDILLLDDLIIQDPELEIPHPRLHLRNFNLIPLVEIVPDFVHPVFKRSLSSLLESCPDTLPVQKIVSDETA